MNEDRREFYEKLDARLEAWGVQIDQLKARSAQVGSEFKTDCASTLDAFQHKHAEGLTRLKGLRAAGDDAWDDLKAGLEKMLAEGKVACDAAVTRFKS